MWSRLVLGLFVALLLSGLAPGRIGPTPAGLLVAEARRGRADAYSHYSAGRFQEAQRAYEKSYRLALSAGDEEEAFRSLNGLGGARFAGLQYREAMQAYLEARRLAHKLGRGELLAVVHTNISSLHLQQQDVNAGAVAVEEALEAARRAGPTRFGPLLRTQAAILRSRQGDIDGALRLFHQALEEADARADVATVGLIWDQAGYELLTRGRLAEAERALVEGFRIRSLNRLPDLQYSYYTLGMLRTAQGDAVGARLLLDQALQRLKRSPATLSLWRVYYERGRASMQMGQAEEALADLLRAVEYARRVRLEVLPADSAWINTGVDQHQLYSALIRVAATLHGETRDPAYARLGFEAAEEIRAAGLRALMFLPAEWRRRLPAEYWETLARLRAAESRLVQKGDPAVKAELSRLHYRLTELEAEAGLSLTPWSPPQAGVDTGLLARVQSAVQEDEVYFSVHLDEPDSYLWAVTPGGFQLLPLPGKRRLERMAGQFHAAVAHDRPERSRLGRELYAALFGAVPERLLAAKRWSLALEGELCKVPVAALETNDTGASPVYLAEKRVVRMVSSALLLEPGGKQDWNGRFVGVGDPIYNAADERTGRGRRIGSLRALWRNGPEGGELPRLPGSGREVEACARAWGDAGQSVVLTGPDASLTGLERALTSGAAVVHFATHFRPSAGRAAHALIALSLDKAGAPELLGPAEISRRRFDIGLVVLSGCASAIAEVAPAEGLMGMTRAWLAAGARSVVATLWPTPDDQGQLLAAFYTHLTQLRGRKDGWVAAEALRSAQLDALRPGSQLMSPAYWGAYMLAGRE